MPNEMNTPAQDKLMQTERDELSAKEYGEKMKILRWQFVSTSDRLAMAFLAGVKHERERFSQVIEKSKQITALKDSLETAVAALEWIYSLDEDPFNHHKHADKCAICHAREALAKIRKGGGV